jgi:cytochrome oxidase assembly protein ShyY1
LEPGYVELVAGTPGVLAPLPLPQLSGGPHFSYALQWLAFGVMAPAGLAYFAWRESRGGSGTRERSHDLDDPHDAPEPRAALANRYGLPG